MKDVVNQALRLYLDLGTDPARSGADLPDEVDLKQHGRFQLPMIQSRRPGRTQATPEQLKESDTEEDQSRHFG
jgi:hypothetical protein